MAIKQTKSELYWEKRRELEDKARLKMEDDMIQSLTKNLSKSLESIQAQLLSQADLHDMTLSELLEDYSLRDQKKYKQHIDKNYKELMKSDEKYQEFIDEFFPSYDYAKVNRLLQIRTDIFNTLASDMIKTDVNSKFNKGLDEIINKTYNSNSNALMYLLGPGDFNPLPKKELENMLNYPWSGKTFSNRLWGNISRLEQNLSNAIVNSVSSGQGVVEALKTMKNDSSISDMFKLEENKFKNAIENLVRTEYAHFAVTGLRKSMSDAGIKDTQSWSAEDERVCSICGERHGKLIKDGWFPPYHGRCRCTAIPKMPELGEDIDKLYDEMFGDLLDEFAKDKFGIKLNKPKKAKVKKEISDLDASSRIKKESFFKEYEKELSELESIELKKRDIYRAKSRELRESNDDNLKQEVEKLKMDYYRAMGKTVDKSREKPIEFAKKITGILSDYREFGLGDLDMKKHFRNPGAKMSKELIEAYKYYPRDWVELSTKGDTILTKKVKNRGYYQPFLSEMALPESGTFRVATHELAHRFEQVNHDIVKAEKEFFERRTRGEKVVRMRDVTGLKYSLNEVTKVDSFLDPYMGKIYESGKNYELFSMGMELLYQNPHKLMEDDDMFNWVIDTLLTK